MSSSPQDEDLEPVARDSRFLIRLVLSLIVGVLAAAFVGAKLRGMASQCGGGLIAPGTSVIPASQGP